MPGQEQPPKRPSSSRYVPFVNRTQAMGSSGWEAYTIGFTLVGCIAAGAGIGWLLDNRLGTSYWLPILFLVGVVAGFREMLQILKRISQNEARIRKEKAEREAANAYTPPTIDASETLTSEKRERLFSVPPPPLGDETSEPKPDDTIRENEPETTEEIIARLLNEADDDETRENRKRS